NTTFKLKGFISDADDMIGKRLMGVKVYENNNKIIRQMELENANTLFVSPLKQEEFVKNPEMVDLLIENGIAIYTMNTTMEWDGKSDISTAQLREIEIEDLLPRDEIEIDLTAIEALLKDKSILITGSAGSIGSEIVKQIAKFGPHQLVLIDQAETPQHDCRLMMASQFPEIKADTIVASICNKRHMEAIFRKYRPDYVFHAAAYKHVPMMEDNPCESIQNNVEGTKIMADLAVKYGVKKFVMISTDKAVNPTNVMGCSKRICEIYVQSLDKAIKEGRHEGQTQFVTTRFGNVLGSSGSVIPLFREQIKNGGPVTVTHPDIIRYFMLIPEACKLVLEAGTMGKGGEIFIFDMGAPVKIADLAKRMIKLSGAKNIEIKYTGLRDGEKLYEEVLNDEEITIPTHHEKIKVAKVREYDFEEVKQQIDQLISDSYLYDDMATVAGMKQIVPEYVSNHSIYEKLDHQTGIPA
ncbi:MAG: polysaccharide biosynthesis protein, partial [Prevotella sp.]|nr:polysaccharide biosynthesis protein [Prevotella sp.]